MNTTVENYLENGCGRCPLGGTPQCKVHSWQQELKLLRHLLTDCGLTEECKWGVPVYTYQQHNVVVMGALKDSCSVSFFKGALLADTEKILRKPGENSQAARLLRFTNPQQVVEIEPLLRAYVHEAIEVEKAGLKVDFNTSPETMPEELQQRLDSLPVLKAAFEALTPGRRRGYIIFISQPKQTQTRQSRIDKCIPLILAGKGLHNRD